MIEVPKGNREVAHKRNTSSAEAEDVNEKNLRRNLMHLFRYQQQLTDLCHADTIDYKENI